MRYHGRACPGQKFRPYQQGISIRADLRIVSIKLKFLMLYSGEDRGASITLLKIQMRFV